MKKRTRFIVFERGIKEISKLYEVELSRVYLRHAGAAQVTKLLPNA